MAKASRITKQLKQHPSIIESIYEKLRAAGVPQQKMPKAATVVSWLVPLVDDDKLGDVIAAYLHKITTDSEKL